MLTHAKCKSGLRDQKCDSEPLPAEPGTLPIHPLDLCLLCWFHRAQTPKDSHSYSWIDGLWFWCISLVPTYIQQAFCSLRALEHGFRLRRSARRNSIWLPLCQVSPLRQKEASQNCCCVLIDLPDHLKLDLVKPPKPTA